MKKPNTETKPITNLQDVLALIAEPLECRFKLADGTGQFHPVTLKVTRAMPSLLEKRRELQRGPVPPWAKERNDYDTLNPAYLKARDAATLQARSLTAYMCCPEVSAMKPGLLQVAEIHQFVSGMLPEPIQELIELTALTGGMDLEPEKRANFTLPGVSES
ncbi:MAG: hypothetical protein ABSE16_01500 [Verrucomicrobiota bacterium]